MTDTPHPLIKLLYATDASIYELTPTDVFVPKSISNLIEIFDQATRSGKSVTIRGAGTSLTGQSIGKGVLIDTTKYLNRILDYSISERWVKVEPGISCAELNNFFKEYSLSFAPDPATISRATIGGMIANNSAGMRSIVHGMTCEHVISLRLLLSSGEIIELSDNLESFANNPDNTFSSLLSDFVKEIRSIYAADIKKTYPSIMRHSGGYALDSLLSSANPNLARLICGSEGTLGVILDATLSLTPTQTLSRLHTLFFPSIGEALSCVPQLVTTGCSALEFIDDKLLSLYEVSASSNVLASNLPFRNPTLLILEHTGTEVGSLDASHELLCGILYNKNCIFHTYYDPKEQEEVWELRRNSLGALNKLTSTVRPIPYIEDSAVPLESLSKYIDEVLYICNQYSVPVTMFGHASVGLIHIRPLHDLSVPGEYDRIKSIQKEIFKVLCKYNGSLSGEHGDGLVRAELNQEFFGDVIFSLFVRLKHIFDPRNLLNPGKIIPDSSETISLRSGLPIDSFSRIQTAFKFHDHGDFIAASNKCTGVANCRKTTYGVMCPSFMATRDEIYSTRARSNALRYLALGRYPQGLFEPGLDTIIGSCLSCKGCTTECPNNVDIPRLKSEFHYQRGDFKTLRSLFFAYQTQISDFIAGPQASIFNFILSLPYVSKALNKSLRLAPNRPLPQHATSRFSEWAYRHNTFKSNNAVALFLDSYIEHFHPSVGKSTIKLLNELGYQVYLTPLMDSQRSSISQGNLLKAQHDATHVLDRLSRDFKGLPILFCEPSSLSAFMLDLPDLLPFNFSEQRDNMLLIDQFLLNAYKSSSTRLTFMPLSTPSSTIFFHPHCHQHSTSGSQVSVELLSFIPRSNVISSNAGCCGMGGAFGYEIENYDLSLAVASQDLLPKISELPADTVIVTNGFSCRHQILDLTSFTPLHTVELLCSLLPLND